MEIKSVTDTSKIDLINIEDEDDTSSEVLKLSEIYWKDYLEEQNYNKDINKMCEECIQTQYEKYGRRTIPCSGSGLAEKQLGGDVFKEITATSSQEEIDAIKAVYNSYDFMESYCDINNKHKDKRLFKGRWYQQFITSCTARSKVVRMGRRAGKALDVNTPIPTPSGWKTMGELKAGDQVFDELGNPTDITFATEYQYDRNCYNITFDTGTSVVADEDHLWEVYINSEEDTKVLSTKDIIDLGIGNRISVRVTAPVKYSHKKLPIDPDTFGYILASKASESIDHIPEQYLLSSIEQREQLLKGIIEGSKAPIDSYKIVKLKTNNSTLFYNLKQLISSLGYKVYSNNYNSLMFNLSRTNDKLIVTSIDKVETRPVKCISVDSKNSLYLATRDYIVTHNTMTLAMEIIHKCMTDRGSKGTGHRALLVSPYQVQTDEVVNTIKLLCNSFEVNPIVRSKASPAHMLEFNTGSILMGFTAGENGDSIRGQPADSIWLDECLTGDTLISTPNGMVPIKNIKIGDVVYSLVDGMIKENTVTNSSSTGFKKVYKYTFDNGDSLVCTNNHPVMTSKGWLPIEQAFDILLSTNKISKLVSVEYVGIEEVYNLTVNESHSYIANGFITHNCDDIPAKAITSLAGIFMDNPDVAVWKSGTPKGELNLYNAAQEQHTKEFHYPSFVIPHYSDQIDNQLRGDMDEIGYIQECLALYGASSNGIFQIPFIEEACSKLDRVTLLDVLSDRSRYITIIGVDWNHDQVGTRIVTIAYDKLNPQFYIIRKDKVALEGWTQQKAIDTIIKINRKVRADHIYVDAGFGATQIGELRMFGETQKGKVDLDSPDLKLVDVQAVDFGSSIEVKDPTSDETFKQGMKQFIVQNAVQVLEKQLLSLDKDEDKDIISQMKNYVQKSRNKGRVVYGCVSKKIGDHDLDAFMIALFGFKKEYSSTLKGLLEVGGFKFAYGASNRNIGDNSVEVPEDYMISDDFAISFSSKKQPIANRSNYVVKYNTLQNKNIVKKRKL